MKLEQIKNKYPKVLTTTETLNEVIKNKKSLCRYGDGEYNLCSKELKGKNIFQLKNEILEERLKEILVSEDKNILICIPPFEGKYNEFSKNDFKFPKFWKRYYYENGEIIIKLLNKNKVYGSAFVSRLTVFYENELTEIKKMWNNKKIVFVYSDKGRFEKDERIFDNILSSEEILIPAINAFSEYDFILKKCLEKEKDKLFLIAAGALATILAYDLAKKGYQALDIGHLPNSYKEFLGEIISPEDLPIQK